MSKLFYKGNEKDEIIENLRTEVTKWENLLRQLAGNSERNCIIILGIKYIVIDIFSGNTILNETVTIYNLSLIDIYDLQVDENSL